MIFKKKKDYEYKDFKHSSHTIIASLIKPNSTVLDFGCGRGLIGSILIKKKCKLYGVDNDDKSLKVASKFYEKTYKCDLDYEYYDFNKKFDYIVCGDIVEHLKEPDKFLANIKNSLGKKGQLIVSIPNVANIYVRLKLLFGRFDYEDQGFLDRTHLRFFTLKTMKQLIEESGFKIMSRYQTPPHLHKLFKTKKKNWFLVWLEEILYWFVLIFKRLLTFQFIFVCEKK